MTEQNDCLTESGKGQAERLGKDWRDVHIDVLYSSTLQRAHNTALRIAKHNRDATLEVITDDQYVEKKQGQGVIDALRDGDRTRATALYTGLLPGQSGITPRDY